MASNFAVNNIRDFVFLAKLDTLYLSELIKEEYIDTGYYNWKDKL